MITGKKKVSKFMQIFLDRIPCFVLQALDTTKLVSGDDKQIHEQATRKVSAWK